MGRPVRITLNHSKRLVSVFQGRAWVISLERMLSAGCAALLQVPGDGGDESDPMKTVKQSNSLVKRSALNASAAVAPIIDPVIPRAPA